MNKSYHSKSAFTLIEVTIALGLASFCLMTVVGLLPIGLNTNQNASEQTLAAGVATAISADLQSNPVASTTAVTSTTSRFGLAIPAPGVSSTTETLFFSVDGQPTGNVNNNAVVTGSNPPRYRATIILTPVNTTAQNPSTSGTNPLPYNKQFNASIMITWPAMADRIAANRPANFSGSFRSLTTVNCN